MTTTKPTPQTSSALPYPLRHLRIPETNPYDFLEVGLGEICYGRQVPLGEMIDRGWCIADQFEDDTEVVYLLSGADGKTLAIAETLRFARGTANKLGLELQIVH